MVVLFVVALMVFGPEKLPELARMLGKATAEFRKMTNDFRFALEDEVREMERSTRIRDEEIASAARAAQAPVPMPSVAPEGAVPRETPGADASAAIQTPVEGPSEPPNEASSGAQIESGAHVESGPHDPAPAETVSVSHEKSADDNPAV